MKIYGWLLGVVLTVGMALGAAAQAVDWDGLAKLAAGTPVWVTIADRTEACVFEEVDADMLHCRGIQSDSDQAQTNLMHSYRREEVRSVEVVPRRQYRKLDDSRGWLDFVVALGGGAGVDARNQPNGYGDFKIGRAITLNLKTDCVSGHCGFGVENSGMVPVLRYPRFVPGKRQDFARLYLEPGVGYRFGKGPFGAYTSAGALIVLRNRPSKAAPYIEYTHRFPFGSPWEGDNRIAVGVIFAVPQGEGVE